VTSRDHVYRQRGYRDALAGQPRQADDPNYRVGYRRGLEELERRRRERRQLEAQR
jgi:hypothetical protein